MTTTSDAPVQIPNSPSLSAARVILKPRKALPFFGRHPWVLASAVDWVEAVQNSTAQATDAPDVEAPATEGADESSLDGQIVDLYSEKRKFIARGFYNSQSRIRVRLFTWQSDQPLDEPFWRRKIAAAIELRRQIGYESPSGELHSDGAARPATDACRLIFSEANGLSGLIVDRYGDYLVLQATSLAVAQRLEMIVPILFDLLQPRGILLRSEKSMAQLEGVALTEGHVWGEAPGGPVELHEKA